MIVFIADFKGRKFKVWGEIIAQKPETYVVMTATGHQIEIPIATVIRSHGGKRIGAGRKKNNYN